MRTTTLAALAFGLSLAGAPAFAADYGQGQNQDRDRDKPAADQQQDQKDDQANQHHDRGDRGKGDRTRTEHAPPSAMHKSDYNNDNNNNRGDDNDRNRDRERTRDRSNDTNDSNRWNDNNRNNNDRFNNNRRNDTNFRDRDRRSGFNWTQYRRNFKSPRRFHIGVYHAPRGYYYRRWSYGQRLPIEFYARDYWLLDFIAYGLFAPPPGCVWVRYGDDALLIDTETGEIIQVRYDVFYS
jgi:Ni/Co efflux regulator RcnB